jgi:hypothetical protein
VIDVIALARVERLQELIAAYAPWLRIRYAF